MLQPVRAPLAIKASSTLLHWGGSVPVLLSVTANEGIALAPLLSSLQIQLSMATSGYLKVEREVSFPVLIPLGLAQPHPCHQEQLYGVAQVVWGP